MQEQPSPQPKALALIATGSELTCGQIRESNLYQISQLLTTEHMCVNQHMLTDDQQDNIAQAIEFSSQNHAVVLITGGLGPTGDDRSRFALAQALDVKLVLNQELKAQLEKRCKQLGIVFTPGHEQQCLFPKDAQIIPNEQGSASGCLYHRQNTLFISLPGPPTECLPMFEQHVLPYLKTQSLTHEQRTKSHLLLGVGESSIAAPIDDLCKKTTGIDIAYRLDPPYLEVKVTTERRVSQGMEPQIQAINKLLKPYCISHCNKKSSIQLAEALETYQGNIVINDGISQGAFAQQWQDQPALIFQEKPQDNAIVVTTKIQAQEIGQPIHFVGQVTTKQKEYNHHITYPNIGEKIITQLCTEFIAHLCVLGLIMDKC